MGHSWLDIGRVTEPRAICLSLAKVLLYVWSTLRGGGGGANLILYFRNLNLSFSWQCSLRLKVGTCGHNG